jgi:hypothetical protein
LASDECMRVPLPAASTTIARGGGEELIAAS